MIDLQAIDGGAETAADTAPSDNGRRANDPVARLKHARAAPSQTVDQDGKVLKQLTAANAMAGLKGTDKKPGNRIRQVTERGEGTYDLALENGAVISATGKQLFDPRHMDAAITQAAKSAPDWHTPKEWRPFAVAVISAATPDDATGSEREETREWLASFLGQNTASRVDLDDAETLYLKIAEELAFWDDDRRLYIRPPRLFAHVVQVLKQRTTASDVRRRLGRLGFTKPRNAEGKLTARKGDSTATGRYLASEPGFEVD